MNREYYVIVAYESGPGILGLDAKTEREAEQAISWQRRGGFYDEMHVCTYDKAQGAFVSVATGAAFKPTHHGYTQAAWEDFQTRLNA